MKTIFRYTPTVLFSINVLLSLITGQYKLAIAYGCAAVMALMLAFSMRRNKEL